MLTAKHYPNMSLAKSRRLKMSDSYLDSLKEQIDYMKERLADLKSGRVTVGEIRNGAKIDTTADEIADDERRISVLERVWSAWKDFNAKRS
jgi:hypothetical protein